jgi:hypothetical protein
MTSAARALPRHAVAGGSRRNGDVRPGRVLNVTSIAGVIFTLQREIA